MSKLIQAAYSYIDAGKFKKAYKTLCSPELKRYTIAQVRLCTITPYSQSLKGICCIYLGNREKARESIENLIVLLYYAFSKL